MRKSHKKPQKATQNNGRNEFKRVIAPAGLASDDLDAGDLSQAAKSEDRLVEAAATGALPPEAQHQPWETPEEHEKFHFFMLCPGPRSVRKAYQLYCRMNGLAPNQDPPSSWYKLYRGEYAAFRRAKQQLKAIEHAGIMHGRAPDWEGLELAAAAAGKIGQLAGDSGEIMDGITLIEQAFWSLAINLSGDPIPGMPTWAERLAMQQKLIEDGKASPPPEPSPAELQEVEARVKRYFGNE
jgi:hypothetical protein